MHWLLFYPVSCVWWLGYVLSHFKPHRFDTLCPVQRQSDRPKFTYRSLTGKSFFNYALFHAGQICIGITELFEEYIRNMPELKDYRDDKSTKKNTQNDNIWQCST